jgi:hypothetical protein
VVRRDDISISAAAFLEPYTVTNRLAGASQDFSHFMLRNEFFREDGKLAARLTSRAADST